MMRTICLTLAYEGTRYSGWQVQPGQLTVQGALAEAIHIVSGEHVASCGSSRTDAGVHALGQVVAFTTASDLDPAVWVRALNATLPDDVSVLAGSEVPSGFDPIRMAVRKRYRYRIHDAPFRPVLGRQFVWRRKSRLDTHAMQVAADILVGEHDFTSFETTPSTRLSKVRTIHTASVVRHCGADGVPGAEVWVEVDGNGFLHNMVRIIVGSLGLVGAGKQPSAWMREAIAARTRAAAGPTAPPEGLVLVSIEIDPNQMGSTAANTSQTGTENDYGKAP